jgi:mono/diheme cytochrome c family protein
MNRILVALFALLFAACKQAPSTDPMVRGERYFNGLGCVKCHQIGDAGHPWGPDLTMVGFRKSEAWLDAWLRDPHGWNPKTVMPDFNLNDEARADLVKYLGAQKGQAWATKPWETEHAKAMSSVERGALLFDKAGCITCHGQDGAGGYPNNNVAGGLIPSLKLVSEGYTRQELLQKVKDGAVPIPSDSSAPLPLLQMPKCKETLKDQEINAVVDYLFSLKPKAAKGAKPAADDF